MLAARRRPGNVEHIWYRESADNLTWELPAHPVKVRAIAEARIKTDRIDSRILAHLLRCDLVPPAYVRPKAQRPALLILRERMFFVRVQTMVKNRIHVLVDRQPGVREIAAEFSDLFGAAGLAWLRTVELPTAERQLLDGELELLEQLRLRIAESDGLVKQLGEGDRRVAWVRTIPGFGPFSRCWWYTRSATSAASRARRSSVRT